MEIQNKYNLIETKIQLKIVFFYQRQRDETLFFKNKNSISKLSEEKTK